MARAFFSRTATSAASFFLPSARSFVVELVAVVSFGSSLLSRTSSLLTPAVTKLFNSRSTSSAATPAMASFDLAVPSLAFLIAASVSSASSSMATDVRVFAFMTSPNPVFSAAAVSPSASTTVFVASSILPCSSCFSSAMCFSFSSLSTLRAMSLACSRAMPTCTLSCWKRSFLTTFAPPLRSLTMTFSVSVGTVNLNSPFA
mmetsp:Transcript_77983/g.200793  ORF Transcript_77983/g.200793 Transcript_77983/m.200793 type:complete len:202 (-) Transcript_77983:1271-1876(-)